MWHFVLMMLAPPNAGMRLAMSQSSTTLASHAFSVPSFALAFAISFWPCCFPCSERHPSSHPQIWSRSLTALLSEAKPNAASFRGCLCFSVLGASTLCKLQSRGHSLMMEALLHRSFWCDVAISGLLSLKSELQASCHSMSLSELLMAHSTRFGEQSSLLIWTAKMAFFFFPSTE